jgi:gliding motility-associated-like protein
VVRSLPIFVKQNPLAQISLAGVVCSSTPQLFTSVVQSIDKVTFHKWQFSNGATGDEPTIALTFPQTGNYSVTLITGTEFSCFDTARLNFTVNLTPTIVARPPSVVLCKGNTVNLTVTGGNTYTWFPNEGLSCTNCPTPIASPQSSIAYIVKGESLNGCFAFDTVDIKVVQPIKMEFGLGDTICIGQSTNLFARGAFSYTWSPALGLNRVDIPNPIASPTVTTRYQVIGRDENNCFADTATMLVAVGQYPVVSLGPDVTLATGDLYPLKNVVTNGPIRTWEWTPPLNLNCNNCPEPIATIKNSITYKLKATNNFGCSGSDTINIKAICENTQVFIPNAFTPDNNGKNDVFMVRGKGILQVKSMRIFNRWGQLVFEKSNFPPNDPAFGWNGRINNVEGVSNVFAYIVEVVCENGTPFFYRGNVTLIK